MWRFLHVFAIIAVMASAGYVYSIKYQTIFAAEEVVKTKHLIAQERGAIAILRAEYAHLSRPDRIETIADSALGMQQLVLGQIVKASDIPFKSGKVDSIGQKLEALGLVGDSATPNSGVTGATPSLR
jgi:cell division protein FtsL